jgi:UDP-2,3-diacylglucosamine hydrolase
MDLFTPISADEVFFLADFHFRDARRPGEALRRRRFRDFLSAVPGGSAVFLLGDIFDFYFEYASVVSKRFFDVLRALSECAGRGIDIHFLAGNHDYWFGNFLRDDVGIVPHGDDVFFECQGRRVWCTHGDLFMPGDRSYRAIRAILRNRWVIAATKLLHPDLLTAIADRVSDGSKKRDRGSVEHMARRVAARPAEELFSRGNDALVMGHIHYPLHEVKNGKDLVIVGDWVNQFSFARLRDGKIALATFSLEGKD